MSVIEYALKPAKQPKYLSRRKLQRLRDQTTWIESRTKNQWLFRDYHCYYIVIAEYKKNEFTVTCSGARVENIFKTLDEAKQGAFEFCNKLLQ
jgi:hypothetical protein